MGLHNHLRSDKTLGIIAGYGAWPTLCRHFGNRWACLDVPSWSATGVCLADLHCLVELQQSQTFGLLGNAYACLARQCCDVRVL